MTQVKVSEFAILNFRKLARNPLPPTPRNSDGTYTIELTEDTLERIANVALDGESQLDTIERVLGLAAHGIQ